MKSSIKDSNEAIVYDLVYHIAYIKKDIDILIDEEEKIMMKKIDQLQNKLDSIFTFDNKFNLTRKVRKF
jgi:hypothetical protein